MTESKTLDRIENNVLLAEDDLIPVVLIAAEIGQPVDRTAHYFGDAVVLDDVGIRAVSASAARDFFTARAEWKAKHGEEAKRRREERAPKPRPVAGVPAEEGLSPFESLAAAEPLVSPSEEFGGRPSPDFLEEALTEGQREQARRRAEAKAKGQAVDKMKEDLR